MYYNQNSRVFAEALGQTICFGSCINIADLFENSVSSGFMFSAFGDDPFKLPADDYQAVYGYWRELMNDCKTYAAEDDADPATWGVRMYMDDNRTVKMMIVRVSMLQSKINAIHDPEKHEAIVEFTRNPLN